jgi:DNA-binding CsgD family transcriptional regulator
MTVDRRFSAWLDFVSELLRTRGSFPKAELLDELASTFEAWSLWAWRAPDGSFGFDMPRPIPGWPTSEWADRVATQLVLGHVDLVRELGVHPEPARQLALPCHVLGGSFRTFVVGGPGPDFSDEDLHLAHRLQPLLALLDRQYQAGAANREAAARAEVGANLTGRELSVLQLLSEGRTASAIAHRLGISPRTVHVHLQNVYRKLGVSDRLLAVRIFHESGLSPLAQRLTSWGTVQEPSVTVTFPA